MSNDIAAHKNISSTQLTPEPSPTGNHSRKNSKTSFASLEGIIGIQEKDNRPTTPNRSNSSDTVGSTSTMVNHAFNHPCNDVAPYLPQYKFPIQNLNNYIDKIIYTNDNIIEHKINKRLEASVDIDIKKVLFEMMDIKFNSDKAEDIPSTHHIITAFFETLRDRKNGTFEDFQEKIKQYAIPDKAKKRLHKLFDKISPKNHPFRSKTDCNEIINTVEFKLLSHQNFFGDMEFVKNILNTFERKYAQQKIIFFLEQNDKFLDIQRKFKKPEEANAEYDKLYQKINSRLHEVKTSYEIVLDHISERKDLVSTKKAYQNVKKLARIDPIHRSGKNKFSEDINQTLGFFRKSNRNWFKKAFKKSHYAPTDMPPKAINGMEDKSYIIKSIYDEMTSLKRDGGRIKGGVPTPSLLYDILSTRPIFIEKIQSLHALTDSKEMLDEMNKNSKFLNDAYPQKYTTEESLKNSRLQLEAARHEHENQWNIEQAEILFRAASENDNKLDMILREGENNLMARQAQAKQAEIAANNKFIIYDIICNIISDIK